ncbi:MAG: hypothetical protein ACYTFA_02810 [Planctomycetota bacterium]|jgi:hypothetical protein
MNRTVVSRVSVVAVGVAILAAMLANLRWNFGYQGQEVALVATHGCLMTYVRGHNYRPKGLFWGRDKWYTGDLYWRPGVERVADGAGGEPYHIVWVPLWIPLCISVAGVGVPAVIRWRRARRPPPGYCRKCRYNLTGNTSGVCPECGTAREINTVILVRGGHVAGVYLPRSDPDGAVVVSMDSDSTEQRLVRLNALSLADLPDDVRGTLKPERAVKCNSAGRDQHGASPIGEDDAPS